MNTSTLVQKLWNYCNVLRDDGISYGDYVGHLTYPPFSYSRFASRPLRGHEPSLQRRGSRCLEMADERSRPPFNQPSPIRDAYTWPALLVKDGDGLFDHHRHTQEDLGKQRGTLVLNFGRAQECAESAA